MKYDPQSDGLDEFKSHRVVRAAPIAHISFTEGTPDYFITLDNKRQVTVPRKNRPVPVVGDRVMFYDDGYISFCPKASFEAGYSLVDRETAAL